MQGVIRPEQLPCLVCVRSAPCCTQLCICFAFFFFLWSCNILGKARKYLNKIKLLKSELDILSQSLLKATETHPLSFSEFWGDELHFTS